MPEATAEALVARFQIQIRDEGRKPRPSPEPLQSGLTGSRRCWPVIRHIAASREWRYVTGPTPDCFFRDEDPLALIAGLPGLRAVELRPDEPWPSLEELDPFACNLTMLALTGAAAELGCGTAGSEQPGKWRSYVLDHGRACLSARGGIAGGDGRHTAGPAPARGRRMPGMG